MYVRVHAREREREIRGKEEVGYHEGKRRYTTECYRSTCVGEHPCRGVLVASPWLLKHEQLM